MVEYKIYDSILAYTRNRMVSYSDDKVLSSRADVIYWNSLKKKKNSTLFNSIIPIISFKIAVKWDKKIKKKVRFYFRNSFSALKVFKTL